MESWIDTSRNGQDRSLEQRLDKLAKDIKKLPAHRIDKLEKLVRSMSKSVVSIKEAADILGVSQDTIRRAIKSGGIKAFQLNKLGNWKIAIEEVEKIIKSGS